MLDQKKDSHGRLRFNRKILNLNNNQSFDAVKLSELFRVMNTTWDILEYIIEIIRIAVIYVNYLPFTCVS